MRKNILFLMILIANSLFSETEFTKGENSTTKCEIQCPPMKDGFFGRFSNFNYDTGETTCYVYSMQNPSKILGTVANVNPHCSKDLINPNKSTNFNSNSTIVNSHLEAQRNQILTRFTDGGFDSYVNLPKYMVAGLMADDKIIDIFSSIASNEVVLNGGYTNQVNLNYANGDKVTNADMLSRSKNALANSVTFVINFLNSSDKILLSFKVALFLFVVALSVILLITQKATKKVSQVADHEDITEKIVYGVLSILLLFLSINKIQTPNGQISQTGYQQIIRPLIYMGISTADKLTETASQSVLKYKFSEVGINSTSDLQTLEDLLFSTTAKHEFVVGMMNLCERTYKSDEIANRTKSIANNYKFPNSEYITLSSKNNLFDGGETIGFYNKIYMINESDIKEEKPSVSFCFKVEKSKNELTAKINDLKLKINGIKLGGNTKINEKINTITELHYKNVAEFGFLSIGSLATTTMAFNNFSLLREENENEKTSKVIEDKTKKIREASGYEVSSVVEPDEGFLSISGQINSFITEAPFFMIPGASNLKDFLRDLVSPIFGDGKDSKGMIGFLLDKIPVSWIKGAISSMTNITVDYFVLTATLGILVNIVSIAPLIAIIGASFLVICFYFLSIEVLYLVIPFASIFAFSTGNLEVIKNLVKNTFILAVKPILIVASVVMSLFVYEMFHSLSETLISSMFEPLFILSSNLTNDVSFSDTSSWFNSIKGLGDSTIFLFMKSMLVIVSSIITVFTCFYLVFNGANIFLDLLGMRDGGFDVGTVIGDKVEGKSSIQKMQTGM